MFRVANTTVFSTNLLEKLIRKEKRRTNAVGRFPGENSCLILVYSVLIDTSMTWHRAIRISIGSVG